MKQAGIAREGLPVVTFSEDIKFHLNGDTILATHVPHAHTDGDSFIYFQAANVIHAGDLFFNGFYPFIDVTHGGSLKAYYYPYLVIDGSGEHNGLWCVSAILKFDEGLIKLYV